MIIKVKNLKNEESYEFNVANDIAIVDFHNIVCEKFDCEKCILMYNSRILGLQYDMSRYIKDNYDGFITIIKY